MKGLIVIFLLVCGYLFYPTYDLVMKRDAFEKEYVAHEKGFLSERRCQHAAADAKLEIYRCLPKTTWETIFNTATGYEPEKRYGDPELFKDLHFSE